MASHLFSLHLDGIAEPIEGCQCDDDGAAILLGYRLIDWVVRSASPATATCEIHALRPPAGARVGSWTFTVDTGMFAWSPEDELPSP